MSSEKIKLYTNSELYWEKIWKKIDNAKDRIYIITYAMDNNLLANITMSKLINAAKRGVKVILVVEYLNFFLKYSSVKKLIDNGGIVIKPNPISTCLLTFQIKNALSRFHQKIKLIDNDVFIGSINCNNDYGGYKYGTNKYKDLSLYLKNCTCKEKISNFFYKLNSKDRKINNKLINKNIEKTNNNLLINNEIFLEQYPPEKKEISDTIQLLLSNAEDSITIIQGYYMNIKPLEEILLKALRKGINIQIITSKNRSGTIYKYFLNGILFEKLIQNGASVYEYLNNNLHMKAYLIDNKYLTIGSFNHDITSFQINKEANYLIKKTNNNKYLFNDFQKVIKELKQNSKKVKLLNIIGSNNNEYQKIGICNYLFNKIGFNIINNGLYFMGKYLSLNSTSIYNKNFLYK